MSDKKPPVSETKSKRRPPQSKGAGSRNPAATATAAAPPGQTPPSLDTEHSELARTIASQLVSNTYECMVCTETVKHNVATWSCAHCYRIFHLYCIKKWSKQEESGAGKKFRCPSCQHTVEKMPNKYKCFCGKCTDPAASGFHTPHSCGEPCGNKRNPHCPHKCTQLCHPGPCSDCTLKAPPKKCPCGSLTYTYPCGKPDPKKTCDNICGKKLNCGNHTCQEKCHNGPCKQCEEIEEISCHCGRDDQMLKCGTEAYSCGEACGRLLRCGEHHCTLPCHTGNCPPCDNDPEIIFSCPCGKEMLTEARKKCTDPIPTCGQICDKVLMCGNHSCLELCHHGACQPCEKKIDTTCACGQQRGKVYCKEQAEFKCHKKCKTKLSCGKHECEQICCPHKNRVDSMSNRAHHCSRLCGKKLPCGHPCPEDCHRGPCPMCMNVITHPIACACGAEELIPPLPCGTEPPTCNRPCHKERECKHESAPHNCHFGACPPCMHQVEKTCAGGHKTIAVACYSESTSCGQTCCRPLECGHTCPRKCHAGDCVAPEVDHFTGKIKDRKCTQMCLKPLPCGHKCQGKCHPGKGCPGCTSTVSISCDCGNQKQQMTCKTHQQKKSALPAGMPVALDCNDDCAHQNRLSALASIGGGKSMAKPTKVIYSIKAWRWAKSNIDSVSSIEKKLIEFVKSNQHTVSLPHMPPEKRMMVHELSNVFHINCESVDREPIRSCLLTRHSATTVPSPLLSEAIYDEANDPEAYAERVMANESQMVERTLVVSGPHLTDIAVSGHLKPHCGHFVTVEAHDGDKTEEGFVFHVIFTSKESMKEAYSYLRKHDVAFNFRMYGHSTSAGGAWGTATPPSASANSASAKRPSSHSDPNKGSGGSKPSGGGSGGGASNWATLLKNNASTTATKKDKDKKPVMSTSNKFSSLGRF